MDPPIVKVLLKVMIGLTCTEGLAVVLVEGEGVGIEVVGEAVEGAAVENGIAEGSRVGSAVGSNVGAIVGTALISFIRMRFPSCLSALLI